MIKMNIRLELDDLIGIKTIKPFFDGTSLYLEAENTFYKLYPYGACCSTCYIQHINSCEALYDAEIIRIDNLEQFKVTNDNNKEQLGIIEEWGHRIKTTKGICTIEMRVEHNGYYGGKLMIEKIERLPNDIMILKDF